MDQPRKVVKPARGQLNREIKRPCRCICGKYIDYVLLIAFVYVPGNRYTFYLGTCTFVHVSLLYMNVCVTTAVSVHIMYYECNSTYVYLVPGT